MVEKLEEEKDILLDEDIEVFTNQSRVQQAEDPVIVEIKKEQERDVVLKQVLTSSFRIGSPRVASDG